MPYCKKCGEELPEYAVFCTKCGLKYPVSEASNDGGYADRPQSQQTVVERNEVEQSVTPTHNGAQSEWFKNNSLALYIILGVVAYVLLQFCSQIAFSVFGLGVVLGIFAILCAIAFCSVGAIRYAMSGKANGNKHTTCDVVCLAIGIIGLIYVLFSTIFVLSAADGLSSLSGLLI
ncbi:MAG: zinc-ribbon domain-containing protein [Clostridiales bacterium]|nr:zinc-ribbon domain-containing protein [Clostridiales bacterium]